MLNEISPLGNSDFVRVPAENGAQNEDNETPTCDCCEESGQIFSLTTPDQSQSSEGAQLQLSRVQSKQCPADESNKKEIPPAILSSSFALLKIFGSRLRRLKGEKINPRGDKIESNNTRAKKFSTDAILRLAGHKFIQSFLHPFSTSSLLGLSEQDHKDVELVGYLLSAAEKVGQGKYDCAVKLLSRCDELSSVQGNSVERLVYYFSQSLWEKINSSAVLYKDGGRRKSDQEDLEEALKSLGPCIIAFHEKVPLSQVIQFTSIQAVIEHIADARKVHIVDLEIRSGVHWTILMQSVADQHELHLEHLKITAVQGTEHRSKIEETGKRLRSFAESLNLSFSFNGVAIEDVLGDNDANTRSRLSLFQLDSEETVVVYAHCFFMTMISKQRKLESLMRVIRCINPRMMFLIEVEANTNSSVFVNRFIEALFYNGALFDAVEDCMKNDKSNRMTMEAKHLSRGIRNIVATEGENRTIRYVRINVWRAFFSRFRMEEMEVSMPCVYQATLLLKRFACGSSCSLDMNGKALIVGWKGTPLASLSAWKFI